MEERLSRPLAVMRRRSRRGFATRAGTASDFIRSHPEIGQDENGVAQNKMRTHILFGVLKLYFMREFGSFQPEALRLGIILRFAAGRRRPASVKVFTGHASYVGRGSQINQSLCSL